MLIHLLWLLSKTISIFVFEWCCPILCLRFFCIRPHFWRYLAILRLVHKFSRVPAGMHWWFLRLEKMFIFASGVNFFVIVDDFQLVRSFNWENLSWLYVFTRAPHAFEIFTQSPFVVGSVYIMYCSVLSWFTLRSLGFSISDALCLKLSMELWLLVTLLMLPHISYQYQFDYSG